MIACAQASSSGMDTNRNLHSQLVGWFKILLPLAALALLSTLFLFARQAAQEPDISFATLDEMAREQRITAPRFSGVADDGSVIAISANSARPDTTDRLNIDAPQLRLDAADGTTLVVRAGQGVIDSATDEARLTGLVRLETSSGYMMETTGLTADLGTGMIASHGPLEVQAPYGRITAGAVTILASSDGEGQRMDFTGGVKLVYAPQGKTE